MKLHDYLQGTNTKPSQLAARMGKPASTITRLLKGTRRPSIELARQISDATDGAVTANDFMEANPASASNATEAA